jgi:hypothetical protein
MATREQIQAARRKTRMAQHGRRRSGGAGHTVDGSDRAQYGLVKRQNHPVRPSKWDLIYSLRRV